MIDNRPKVHRPKKMPLKTEQPHQPEQPAEVHIEQVNTAPAHVAHAPVKAKAVPAMPLSGILSGGLGSLGILPVVLIISALQKGNLPFGQQAKPAAKQLALPAVPVEAAAAVPVKENKGNAKPPAAGKQAVKAAQAPAPAAVDPPLPAPATGQKQRNQLRAYKKPVETVKEPDPAPAPVPVSTPKAVPPPRPAPRPADIKNLLSDLSGYLPGNGSSSAARISKIMGIADELRSIDNTGSVYASSLPANPLDRHIGLLNVLGRNLPMAGASNLGRASQVLSLVNTIKGGSGGGQNMAGMLSGMMGGQNMGNMAGMLGGLMGNQSQPQQQQQEMKNVTPTQADGIKDTVNRLLSGMDDKQKNELLDKAKDFLGKSKK